MYKTILAPLDGSDLTASILDQVGRLARGYGARLTLLTVGSPLPVSLPRAQDIQLTHTFQAEAYLERLRMPLASDGLDVGGCALGIQPAKYWKQLNGIRLI